MPLKKSSVSKRKNIYFKPKAKGKLLRGWAFSFLVGGFCFLSPFAFSKSIQKLQSKVGEYEGIVSRHLRNLRTCRADCIEEHRSSCRSRCLEGAEDELSMDCYSPCVSNHNVSVCDGGTCSSHKRNYEKSKGHLSDYKEQIARLQEQEDASSKKPTSNYNPAVLTQVAKKEKDMGIYHVLGVGATAFLGYKTAKCCSTIGCSGWCPTLVGMTVLAGVQTAKMKGQKKKFRATKIAMCESSSLCDEDPSVIENPTPDVLPPSCDSMLEECRGIINLNFCPKDKPNCLADLTTPGKTIPETDTGTKTIPETDTGTGKTLPPLITTTGCLAGDPSCNPGVKPGFDDCLPGDTNCQKPSPTPTSPPPLTTSPSPSFSTPSPSFDNIPQSVLDELGDLFRPETGWPDGKNPFKNANNFANRKFTPKEKKYIDKLMQQVQAQNKDFMDKHLSSGAGSGDGLSGDGLSGGDLLGGDLSGDDLSRDSSGSKFDPLAKGKNRQGSAQGSDPSDGDSLAGGAVGKGNRGLSSQQAGRGDMFLDENALDPNSKNGLGDKSVQFGSDIIGVAEDNIFQMVHRRYRALDTAKHFIK